MQLDDVVFEFRDDTAGFFQWLLEDIDTNKPDELLVGHSALDNGKCKGMSPKELRSILEDTDTTKPEELLVGSSALDNGECKDLSPKELKRLRNRQKQQRCRAKKRAAEAAHKEKVERLSREILHAKHQAGEKLARTLALRANNAAVAAQLADIRAQALPSQFDAPGSRERNDLLNAPTFRQCHAPASVVSDANEALAPAVPPPPQPPQHAQHTPGKAAPGAPACDSKCGETASVPSSACAIFSVERHRRACKYERPLSISHVDTSQPFVDAVAAYRARIAQQLKVEIEDVAWLMESKLYPALTADGGIGSCMKTTESVARLTTLWLATLIETALLLAVVKRLERLRDELPGPCAPPQVIIAPPLATPRVSGPVKGPWQSKVPASDAPTSSGETLESAKTWWDCGAAPKQADAGAAAAAASSSSEDAVSSVPAWAFDEVSTPASADVDIIVRNMHSLLLADTTSKEPVQPQWGGLMRTVHKVFADMFAEYLPWLTAAETTRLCRRVQRSFGQAPPLAGDADGATLTPARSFASVFAALGSVTKAVLLDVRLKPAAQRVPATPQEVQSALDAADKRLESIAYEWGALYSTTCADRPALMRSLAQWVSPVTLGYVEFEKLNMELWRMLELSTEQKADFARLWSAYQRRQRRLVADFDDVARQLLAFRSAADLRLNSVHDVLQLAKTIHAHDIAVAAACCVAGLPSVLESSESDPFAAPSDSSGARSSGGLAATSGGGESDVATAAERPSCMQGLLGVSPEATGAAGRLLARLQGIQAQKNELYYRFLCLLQRCLTSKQRATWCTALMPFNVDAYRIAGMASTDVCCQRVFGKPAICAHDAMRLEGTTV